MKIIDCEFHYYLPELMDYLATRDQAMRYYPETKVLEVRDKIYAHFSGVTNSYPVIDELMNSSGSVFTGIVGSSPLPLRSCVGLMSTIIISGFKYIFFIIVPSLTL